MQASAVGVRAGAAAPELGAADERAASICGNVNPSADNPPACKNVRRAIGLEAFHEDRIRCCCCEVAEFIGSLRARGLVERFYAYSDFIQRSSSTSCGLGRFAVPV